MTRRTGLHPVWWAFIGRIAAITVVALVVWLSAGPDWALAVAVLLLLVMMASRTQHMAFLARWIDGSDERDFPQAGGAWGEVFLALSRRLRWEAQEMARVHAEAAAFREAMAALPDGIVLVNGLSQIVWCNSAAEQHMGINREKDKGRVITHLVRMPGFAEYLQLNDRAEPFSFTSVGDRNVVLGLEVVPVGNGQQLLVSFDVSEIRQAEAMRRDFVANVSHELRTPLTVIHGFLEHLAGDALPEADRRQFVGLMQDQSARMLTLVDDLLTLSRLESERLPRREELIDMDALVARLVDEAKLLSNGRHEISAQIAPVDLRGDPDELRSAFANLLSNAVRYTPEGGKISVEWEDSLGGPTFSVADTGIGIAAEALPRLTERFFRVDKGRSRETGGTGLGLAIVKHVLIRHQADLRILSTPGEGSIFAARMPVERCVRRSTSSS
ncbi:MAG TPA: phosphate regulon sensor histidine kinase PhoR [Rhodocyclaceae bacterium]